MCRFCFQLKKNLFYNTFNLYFGREVQYSEEDVLADHDYNAHWDGYDSDADKEYVPAESGSDSTDK